jgi:hypothetical protein
VVRERDHYSAPLEVALCLVGLIRIVVLGNPGPPLRVLDENREPRSPHLALSYLGQFALFNELNFVFRSIPLSTHLYPSFAMSKI